LGAPPGLVGLPAATFPAGLSFAGLDPTTAALLQKDPNMATLLWQNGIQEDKSNQAQNGQANGNAQAQQNGQAQIQAQQAGQSAANAAMAAHQAQLEMYQNLTQSYMLNNGMLVGRTMGISGAPLKNDAAATAPPTHQQSATAAATAAAKLQASGTRRFSPY
jgi:hypothetical protein